MQDLSKFNKVNYLLDHYARTKTYFDEFSIYIYKYKINFSLTSHFSSENIFYNKARLPESWRLITLNEEDEYFCM